MLKVPSEFPNPGSYALLEGQQVRVIAHRPGGEALVSLSKMGGSITRTIPLADLCSPTPERTIHRRKRRARGAGRVA